MAGGRSITSAHFWRPSSFARCRDIIWTRGELRKVSEFENPLTEWVAEHRVRICDLWIPISIVGALTAIGIVLPDRGRQNHGIQIAAIPVVLSIGFGALTAPEPRFGVGLLYGLAAISWSLFSGRATRTMATCTFLAVFVCVICATEFRRAMECQDRNK